MTIYSSPTQDSLDGRDGLSDKPLGPGDPEYDKWLSEVDYFRSIRESLRSDPALCDKFVAISGHQVIDSDRDGFALAGRVRTARPREMVLVVEVAKDNQVDHASMEERRG